MTEFSVKEKMPGAGIWFDRDRFGMFAHWGPPCIAGADFKVIYRMSKEAYGAQMYQFAPIAFDAPGLGPAGQDCRHEVSRPHHQGSRRLCDNCIPGHP